MIMPCQSDTFAIYHNAVADCRKHMSGTHHYLKGDATKHEQILMAMKLMLMFWRMLMWLNHRVAKSKNWKKFVMMNYECVS